MHSTYKSTKKPTLEDELNNQKALTQFARALSELGVDIIYAKSAQAKGRVERSFETHQDRLIKEMRLYLTAKDLLIQDYLRHLFFVCIVNIR